MVSEDRIRQIVHAIVSEISNTGTVAGTVTETGKEAARETVRDLPAADGKADCCGREIDDLTEIDLNERILVPNPKDMKALKEFKKSTPARIGVWRAGDRPMTETMLRFRADHAAAIDSVFSDVSEDLINKLGLVKVQSMVKSRDEYLTRPDLGRRIDDQTKKYIKEKCTANPQLQIIVSDGLSSRAIEANIKDVLPALTQGLNMNKIAVGTPIFVKYGRVGVMDTIGETLNAEAAIIFIGERPGLATAESMSAYIVYKPHVGTEEAERTVLSNIHRGGTPPVEAGAFISTVIRKVLDKKASGINLKD